MWGRTPFWNFLILLFSIYYKDENNFLSCLIVIEIIKKLKNYIKHAVYYTFLRSERII